MRNDTHRQDRTSRIDVVVQDVASFRIDPAVLARPDRSLALICSSPQREKLDRRNRADVFDPIVVIDDFTPDALASTVANLLDDGGYAAPDVRLLCHDEYRLAAVAAVREKLGIPGDQPVNIRPFADKLTMKAELRDAGIRMPAHVAWDADAHRVDPVGYAAQVLDHVGLPAFVKPIDESGSVGAARIDTAEQLDTWAATADSRYTYEVDEYVHGALYHVDSAVQDGRIVHVRANRNLHPCHEYADGRVNCSFTLDSADPVLATLLRFNEDVLAALADKPRDGVFHHEAFVNPAGEPVFLEIAARAPAALIPSTGRIRWGLDIEEALFVLQRGERLALPERTGPHAAYLYFPKRAGTVARLHRPEIASDHRWTWNVQPGDTLPDATDIRDFAASVLLWNDDHAALVRDLDHLDRWTPFTVEP